MSFVSNPKLVKPKLTFRERFVLFNKFLTKWCGMARINKFIYLIIQKVGLAAKYVRSLEGYEKARENIINTTLTGLLIGSAIFCFKTQNSFLQGISIAITMVIIELELSWLKETFGAKKK